MLKVDLGRLSREGAVLLEERIPQDHALWEGSGLRWSDPVDVRLRVLEAGTGEIVGRGQLSGELSGECRRCLEPVNTKFDVELTMVFVDDQSEADSADAGAYAYNGRAVQLDLSEAVREEVLLALNPYVVCDPDCPGLCPKCGINLKEGSCDCTEDESDSRWDALRELKR